MPWPAAAPCGRGAAPDVTPDALTLALGRVGLPGDLCWAVRPPVLDDAALFDAERAAMRRAVPARVAEFTGGRLAARAAMAQLGLAPQPIPMRADRAPDWPPGVIGSISHACGLCLAIAAPAGAWRGIGVDIEADVDMPAEMISEIASQQELARLAPLSAPRAAMRIFSAKEAAYKAQYPLTQARFGFDAMCADLPRFQMRLTRDVGLGAGVALPILQHALDGVIVSVSLFP